MLFEKLSPTELNVLAKALLRYEESGPLAERVIAANLHWEVCRALSGKADRRVLDID